MSESLPYYLKEERVEPFWTIRRAPVLFCCGVVLVGSSAALIILLLWDRNPGLAIGIQAGYQGGAYLVLHRLCHIRAKAKGRLTTALRAGGCNRRDTGLTLACQLAEVLVDEVAGAVRVPGQPAWGPFATPDWLTAK